MSCANDAGPSTSTNDAAVGADHDAAMLDAGPDAGNDAHGATDAGASAPGNCNQLVYRDADGDGYGASGSARHACPSATWITRGGDCDDHSATVNPAGTESCNETDDDCDGTVDEGVTIRCWADLDGDGFASASQPGAFACQSCQPGKTARQPSNAANTDCNDDDQNVYPGAPEICDGKDYNCNGMSDSDCLCSAGAVRRNVSTSHDGDCDSCGSDQVWSIAQADCAYPSVACDVESSSAGYGTCTDNAPYHVGVDGSEGHSILFLNDNELLAQPIVVTEDLRLQSFGLLTGPNDVGGGVYFSLHADSINPQTGQHEPSTVINRTGLVVLKAGDPNLTPRQISNAANINLTKGTRYWIVANIQEAANLMPPEDVQIYAKNVANPAWGDVRLGTRAFAIPTSLSPGETNKIAGEVTLFIVVQR